MQRSFFIVILWSITKTVLRIFLFWCLKMTHLKAVVPANKSATEFYSHQGLTYGGVVIDPKLKLSEFLNVFESITRFLQANNFKKVWFKALPSIYPDYFS